MPSRNIIKEYVPESYYHIYSRGVNKQIVFGDDSDYAFFISLFKRYLSGSPEIRKKHGPYPYYGENVKLLAFCLMPNHIHLLVYQITQNSITELMRSILTSYSRYFNTKYHRVGPVFQSRYKASRINQDNYLDHISRYIHLNPKSWEVYPYSSIKYYKKEAEAEWIDTSIILNLFNGSIDDYTYFLKDYRDYKKNLDEIKWELADV